MEHQIDSSVWHHDHGAYQQPVQQQESKDWTGTIALVLVIILIIGIIIVLVMIERGGANSVTGSWTWTLVQGVSTGSTDSFTADNGQLYIGNNTGSPLSLSIVPPSDPIGKQFGINNETGSTITIAETGVTISKGTVVYTWTTTSTYIVMSQI